MRDKCNSQACLVRLLIVSRTLKSVSALSRIVFLRYK